MFLPQGDRHKSWLQTYAPLLAGFQGALGMLPCRDDRASDAKSLTVAFWYKILLLINFLDDLMQTVNDGCKDIKTRCKNPRRFFAGNASSSVAAGHRATILHTPPIIAGLPSAVAWPHPTAEGVSSTIAQSHRDRDDARRPPRNISHFRLSTLNF